MRQAIVTKFLGPTNFRGSRVKATCQARSLTVAWDDAKDVDANHTQAARALADALGWLEDTAGRRWSLEGGAMPDDTGYAFVLVRNFYPEPTSAETDG